MPNCRQHPNNPPNCIEIPTSPLEPTLGTGENECNTGIPTQINLPDRTTPCEKTKALLEDPAVKSKIDSLEKKSKTIGEKAFLYMKDNTASAMIDGGDHEVNITPYSGYKGIS
ncbi:hypothetical protein [Chryseobacterium scophthalmum]|uniref:hypothetical protein n=1 Tax=Chryseobacterium scophthalmum TaxID=59733 RepID=UPI001AEBE4FC|nr:hypothetical protein [Chryseobacterium scophthalmum]